MEQPISFFAALAVSTIAVYTDTKRGLIPNYLTFPAMMVGIGLNTAVGGWEGLGFASQGLALGLGLLLLPFLFGGMGAGDVKLMAAIGAFLGPQLVLQAFIFGALMGGAVALLIIIRTHGWFSVHLALFGGWRRFFATDSPTSMASFPYAAAMWVGVVVSTSAIWV